MNTTKTRRSLEPASDYAIVGLAALVAAEHAVLMVASILPDGDRVKDSTSEAAADAAAARLALVERPSDADEA